MESTPGTPSRRWPRMGVALGGLVALIGGAVGSATWLVSSCEPTMPRHGLNGRPQRPDSGSAPDPHRIAAGGPDAGHDDGARADVVAETRDGTLVARVVDEHESPVEGVRVVIAGSGLWPARQISTGPDGSVTVSVPAGIYELRARGGGRVAGPLSGIEIEPGQRMERRLVLRPGRSLEGVVWSADEEVAVAGARVVAVEDGLALEPRATSTDQRGRFHFRELGDEMVYLTVDADGFVPRYGVPARLGGSPLRVELRRAAVVEGIVVDAHGRPVGGAALEIAGRPEGIGGPGAELRWLREIVFREAAVSAATPGVGSLGVTDSVPPIWVAGPDTTSASSHGPSAGARSDAHGRFRLAAVPPGRWQLVARHADHPVTLSEPLLVRGGITVSDVRITLAEGGIVRGRVVDARGAPLERIAIEARTQHDEAPLFAVTDAWGRFELGPVRGRLVVTAWRPGSLARRRATVDVVPPEPTEVVLTLDEQSGRLEGRVVGPRGEGIEGARVSVVGLAVDRPFERTVQTDVDGDFRFDELPAPPWQVRAEHPAHLPSEPIDLEHPVRRLVVQLRPGVTVRGRLRRADDGSPIEGGIVVARSDERELRALTDDEGRFELSGVGRGALRLEARAEGHQPARRALHVRAITGHPQDIDLGVVELEPGATVEGRVLDARGDPVPDAEVTAGNPPDWSAAARTDPRGRFRIDGLGRGQYVLHARHPAAGAIRSTHPVATRLRETVAAPDLRLPRRLDDPAELGPGRLSGIAVVLDVDSPRIVAVVGAQASRAGLRVGDVIEAVDGVDVETAARAAELLRGPSGIEAVLVVRRDGARRTMRVAREVYFEP